MITLTDEREAMLKSVEEELRSYAFRLVDSCPDLPPQQIAGVAMFCHSTADKVKKAIKPNDPDVT